MQLKCQNKIRKRYGDTSIVLKHTIKHFNYFIGTMVGIYSKNEMRA